MSDEKPRHHRTMDAIIKEKIMKTIRRDELRSKKIRLAVSQQAIIELAYAIKDLVGPLTKSHEKLYVDEANCLRSVFYQVREFLEKIDPAYLALHERIVEFYGKKRELGNYNDRLYWDSIDPQRG